MEQRTPEDILNEAIYMCDHKHVLSTIGEPRFGKDDKNISYTFVFYDVMNNKEFYHQRVDTTGLCHDQIVMAVWRRIENLIKAHNDIELDHDPY